MRRPTLMLLGVALLVPACGGATAGTPRPATTPSAVASTPGAPVVPVASPSPGTPSGRGGAAMAFDAARGVVVMFGGDGTGGRLSDTWTWDGSGWTRRFPSVSPPPRAFAAMTYDVARQRVVLFGGDSLDRGLLNDTWTWNGSNWHEEHPERSPAPKDSMALAYYEPSHVSILYGGLMMSAGFDRTTWAWDGANWTQLTPSHTPTAGVGGALVYHPGARALVLFGGDSTTWLWTGADWQYQEGPGPGLREFLAMALDATGAVVLHGGNSPAVVDLDATWTWTPTAGWTQMNPAHPPGVLSEGQLSPAMAYDAAVKKSVMFGDSHHGQQTWLWDGADWSLASATATCAVNPLPGLCVGRAATPEEQAAMISAGVPGIEATLRTQDCAVTSPGVACFRLGSPPRAMVGTHAGTLYGTYGSTGCWIFLYEDGSGWHYLNSTCGQGAGSVPGPQVIVKVDGCANVRDAAAMSGRIVDCLVNGTIVDVDSAPVYADGHVWWHLVGRGWTAHDYLVGPPAPA